MNRSAFYFSVGLLFLLASCSEGKKADDKFAQLPAFKKDEVRCLNSNEMVLNLSGNLDWKFLPFEPAFLRQKHIHEIIITQKKIENKSDTTFGRVHIYVNPQGRTEKMIECVVANDQPHSPATDTITIWNFESSGANQFFITEQMRNDSGSTEKFFKAAEEWLVMDDEATIYSDSVAGPGFQFWRKRVFENGKITSETKGNSFDTPFTTYFSYSHGYLAATKDSGASNSTKYEFEYDNSGRIKSKTGTDPRKNETYRINYSYDANGNISQLDYQHPVGNTHILLNYSNGLPGSISVARNFQEENSVTYYTFEYKW